MLKSRFEFDLNCKGRPLRLGRLATDAVIMGILNVTPDSFSDGGDYYDTDAAVDRANQMIAEGATIIDIGGASSRPAGSAYGKGSEHVDPTTETARVVPVIEGIRQSNKDVFLSIDTYHSSVAAAALDAGADIVNDITALRYSPDMIKVVRKTGAALVVMHSHGTPGNMPHELQHDHVIEEVKTEMSRAIGLAYASGVTDICIDPGFGFGKTMAENFELINRIDELLAFGLPLLVGISRKTMIGAAVGSATEPAPLERRLVGSVVAAAHAVRSGASIIRTHDVQETADMLKVLQAIETEHG